MAPEDTGDWTAAPSEEEKARQINYTEFLDRFEVIYEEVKLQEEEALQASLGGDLELAMKYLSKILNEGNTEVERESVFFGTSSKSPTIDNIRSSFHSSDLDHSGHTSR
tara:strand:- start:268 stop:594 length:327 start_codon:yes stop_codon:yes gene_type:complete